jgi:hypothetical protein
MLRLNGATEDRHDCLCTHFWPIIIGGRRLESNNDDSPALWFFNPPLLPTTDCGAVMLTVSNVRLYLIQHLVILFAYDYKGSA